MKTAVVTIDVEPDYPPEARRNHLGIQKALPRIMDILRSEHVPANIFMLADLCESNPTLAKEIIQGGFSLGNHSLHHRLLCLEDFAVQWTEIKESSRVLSEVSGTNVVSFRAPNFSLDGNTLRCLERANYIIDSSILPGRRLKQSLFRSAYDFRGAPSRPYHASHIDVTKHGRSLVLEIPASENPFNLGAPIGGGFLNTFGLERTLKAIASATGDPVVLVFHPWEFVNLSDKFPDLPIWIRKGCREDFDTFSQLMHGLKEGGYRLSTLESVAKTHQKM